MTSETTNRLSGLPPVFNARTNILIFGSFPGATSLVQQSYYANERNHFWDIIFRCLDPAYQPYKPVRESNRDKKYQLLLEHQVGLWDVIASCERKGSSDSKIKHPLFNDLPQLLRKHPIITRLIFNGRPAFSFFKQSKQVLPSTIKFSVLNSTSTMNPNNTFHVLEEWLNWFGATGTT